MTEITLNGAAHAAPEGATLLDLVAATVGRPMREDGTAADGQGLGVAVALDSAVVPRGRWRQTPVRDGQSVEIITAVQGG